MNSLDLPEAASSLAPAALTPSVESLLLTEGMQVGLESEGGVAYLFSTDAIIGGVLRMSVHRGQSQADEVRGVPLELVNVRLAIVSPDQPTLQVGERVTVVGRYPNSGRHKVFRTTPISSLVSYPAQEGLREVPPLHPARIDTMQ